MADTTSGVPSGQKLSTNIDSNTNKQAKFNKELDVTLQKANAILKAFGMPAMGGGGGGSLTTAGTFTNGGLGGSGMGGSILSGVGRLAITALGVASGAAQALPGVQEVLGTQLLTSQARFSGVANPIAAAQAAMRGGQATSPTDVLQAIQSGARGGLVGALPGYGGILKGVSQISNLTGDPQSAMKAAVGLNSAQSVNTLRMFGIQARGANGAARPASEVFKDIYNFASAQVGKKLTPQEVAIGLQPGNGLANFLDAAAAGNPDLRNALQLAAQQFAKGGDLTRASTNKTGITTAAQGAQSDLFAAQLGTQAAAAPAMSQGFIEGANLLIKFNKSMQDTLANSKLANDAVKQLAKAETLAADNIGKAGLSVLSVIAASGLVGGAFSGAKNLIGKFGTSSEAITKAPSIPSAPPTSGLLGPNGQPLATTASTTAETAAQTLGKSGLLTKVLGPVGIYYTGKSIIGSTVDALSWSRLTGKRVADPKQSTWNAILHGTRYVDKNTISGLNPGSSGLGNDASSSNYSPESGIVSGLNPGSSGLGQSASVSGSAVSGSNSGSSSAVVNIALTQQGVPYSWGAGNLSGPTTGMGSGTNTVGFDCSSFVRFVMAKVGAILPRTAHEQQRCGTQINPQDAQPGDLLFWGQPAHHVAIYMGKGMMIEAPHTGDVVKRTGVNLKSVTTCSRILGKATGTHSVNNIMHAASGYKGSGNYGVESMASQVSVSALRGNTPQDAMSGGSSSSSGLGLGESTSVYSGSSNGHSSAQKYMFINPKTGTLETTQNANQTVFNYGGVTVEVKVPHGAQVTAKDVAKAVKDELKSLNISAKVATK